MIKSPLILSFSPRGEGTVLRGITSESTRGARNNAPSPLGERAGVRGSWEVVNRTSYKLNGAALSGEGQQNSYLQRSWYYRTIIEKARPGARPIPTALTFLATRASDAETNNAYRQNFLMRCGPCRLVFL